MTVAWLEAAHAGRLGELKPVRNNAGQQPQPSAEPRRHALPCPAARCWLAGVRLLGRQGGGAAPAGPAGGALLPPRVRQAGGPQQPCPLLATLELPALCDGPAEARGGHFSNPSRPCQAGGAPGPAFEKASTAPPLGWLHQLCPALVRWLHSSCAPSRCPCVPVGAAAGHGRPLPGALLGAAGQAERDERGVHQPNVKGGGRAGLGTTMRAALCIELDVVGEVPAAAGAASPVYHGLCPPGQGWKGMPDSVLDC